MKQLEELRARGALIEVNAPVIGNAIFLGYDEENDYDEKLGRFRVGWLINDELYYIDVLADKQCFVKAENWNWAEHEHPKLPAGNGGHQQ